MTETESVDLGLYIFAGIPLPAPASPEDYPDESFSDAYQAFREYWQGRSQGDGPENSLSSLPKYAEFMRWVHIPTAQLVEQWKQQRFGQTEDLLPKENAMASTVRGFVEEIARERYKKRKEQRAAGSSST